MKIEDAEIGSVVALQSGGPDMTVKGVVEDQGVVELRGFEPKIACIWFDQRGHLQSASFAPELLYVRTIARLS